MVANKNVYSKECTLCCCQETKFCTLRFTKVLFVHGIVGNSCQNKGENLLQD